MLDVLLSLLMRRALLLPACSTFLSPASTCSPSQIVIALFVLYCVLPCLNTNMLLSSRIGEW